MCLEESGPAQIGCDLPPRLGAVQARWCRLWVSATATLPLMSAWLSASCFTVSLVCMNARRGSWYRCGQQISRRSRVTSAESYPDDGRRGSCRGRDSSRTGREQSVSIEGPEDQPGPRRVEVEAIVATSHPVSAYGGIQLDESVLHDIAEAIRSGSLPMLIGHDIRRPLNPTVLDAQVRQRPDGYKEVRIRFSVDADAWAQFEQELAASGAPGGFSFAFSEPIADLPPLASELVAPVAIEADASHWSDEDLLAAAEDLRAIGPVHVGRRYQFAFEPLAVVVLTLVVAPIVTGLIANAISDGLKRFLRRGQRTIFQFRVEREDGSSVDARLETDDPEALQHAIGALNQLVNTDQLNEWNEKQQIWEQLQRSGGSGHLPRTKSRIDRSTGDVAVPAWIEKLGITDRPTGQERARASRDVLISVGSRVLDTDLDYRVEHLVFSGLFTSTGVVYEVPARFWPFRPGRRVAVT
jgi:hypothetical protein